MDNSTSSPILNKKTVIAAVIAITAILLGAYYYQSKNVMVGEEKKAQKKEVKSEMTGLELAKELDAWAESKMKKKDGNYILRRNCVLKDGAGKCTASKAIATNVWTVPLGYFELYRATGEEKYKKIADGSLEQGIKYACETKKSEACMHYSLPAGIFYSYTNDDKYKRFNESLRPFTDEHRLYHEDIASGRVKDDHMPNDYFMHAGHMMDFYNLTKEDKYRDSAIAMLKEGQKKAKDPKANNAALYKAGSFTVTRSHCFELLTYVDFYRILMDKKYLTDAADLINKAEFHKNPERYAFSWDLAFCAEGYLGLYDLTKEKKYLDGATEIMSWVVKAFMDNPSNNYYTGKFSILDSRGGSEKNIKDLGLNMWFMSELARFKDITFKLK